MPAPQYVRRSYAGGAEAAAIVNQMGSTDTSFTIASTTGWVEEDGSPLGTIGPFTVAIDLYTPSVEKVLCSAINLLTGVVTVYVAGDGWSGRGYDGTTAQAHVPGGSTSGVQPCWSSVEADEANQAVYDVLGGGSEGLVGVPIGSLVPFGGTLQTLPSNFLDCNGAAVSRTAYSACFSALTVNSTCNSTTGGATLTNVPAGVTDYVWPGDQLTLTASGGAIYTVSSVTSTTIVLTSGVGITAATGATFVSYPHGAGDGSTTFNLPDARGRTLAGYGGVGTNAQPDVNVGQGGGTQTITLTSAQLASHSHTSTVTDPGHSHSFNTSGDQTYVAPASGTTGFNNGSAFLATLTTPTIGTSNTGITTSNANTGSGAAINVTSPFLGVTYIIRVT